MDVKVFFNRPKSQPMKGTIPTADYDRLTAGQAPFFTLTLSNGRQAVINAQAVAYVLERLDSDDE